MPLSHDPELELLRFNSKNQVKSSLQHHPSVTTMRKPSEESIRTEFCDGPEPDPPEWIQALEERAADMAAKDEGNWTSDRAELIKRIKRGESPTWVPSQALEKEYLKQDSVMPTPSAHSVKRKKDFLPLLTPLDTSNLKEKPKSPSQTVLSPPEEIRRPKSALHTGNFTEGSEASGQGLFDRAAEPSEGALGTSPTTPLYPLIAPWGQSVVHDNHRRDERESDWSERRSFRSRPPSLQSFSSSYVLKAPTTPLVQQSNSTDIDLSTISPLALSESPKEEGRRHTLPPHALSSSSFHAPSSPISAYQPVSSRIDNRLPHQMHRPQRSLTDRWSLQVATSPQSSRYPGSRRQSHSSEISSRRRASMVGSYEESILRGSMSTAPSKPLDFTAQIGVLGKDNCKPKCPAHVTVPFPAVFYSYSSGNGSQSIADEPSPYVGLIDIQHLLPAAEPERGRRRRHRSPGLQSPRLKRVNAEQSMDKQGDEEGTLQVRKRRKRREESPLPDVPPGGSYRIPQIGQLQIIIKNPNKTAVKLFLVPYDLTAMESGTKTFIRQRCYCSDTPVDGAMSSKSDDAKRASTGHGATKKPSLRYLIHVNICCPSKGRFYLYHHIRVVFANRVPDNKEQLQNDIQLPDPRFSPYNPLRESLTPRSAVGAQLTDDKAFRRRSAGFGSESDAIGSRYTQSLGSNSDYPFGSATPAPPVPPIPFDLVMPKPRPNPDVSDAETSRPTTATDSQSPTSDKRGYHRSTAFGSLKSNSSNGSDSYTKLNKADTSNGGVYGRPNTPEPGEGLLARKLRGFALQRGEVFDDE